MLDRLRNVWAALTGPTVRMGAQEPFRAGSRTDRTLRSWMPGQYSADRATLDQLDILLARARDEGRNGSLSIAVVNALTKHVVGTGINAKADAQDNSGDDFQDFNDAADRLWRRYTERHVDYVSRRCFSELQTVVFRELVESGNSLALQVIDPKLPDGIAFQHLETEQLDTSRDRPRSGRENEIRGGIELDRAGRAVAYWILDEHPYDPQSTASGWGNVQRVPADRVIHVFRPYRHGQTRGVTWLAPLLQNSRDFHGLVGSELQSARIAALFTVLLKREFGSGTGMGLAADDYDDPLANVQLGSGIISDLGPNDSVEVVKNDRPTQQIGEFSKLLFLTQAMAAGISYLALTGDYSQVNYSSARAALNDDKKLFRQLQQMFYASYVSEIRRRWTRWQVVAGRLPHVRPQEFRVDPERWLATEPVLPGWEQVDELKETEAALRRVHGGLSTLEMEAARLGRDWRALLRQRARENAYAQQLGLVLETPDANAVGPSVRRSANDDAAV